MLVLTYIPKLRTVCLTRSDLQLVRGKHASMKARAAAAAAAPAPAAAAAAPAPAPAPAPAAPALAAGAQPLQSTTPKGLTVLEPMTVMRPSSGSSIHPLEQVVRRPVTTAQFINSPVDDGWEIVVQTSPTNKCFTTDTFFQTSHRSFKFASEIKEYDTVLSLSGRPLTVVYKKIHPRTLRELVTLRTPSAEITYTSNHRVMWKGDDGILTETAAENLKKGDLVLCGAREQKLSNVMKFKSKVEVVELCFDPDDAVESFKAPRWGIFSKGQRPSLRISAFSPLGPSRVETAADHITCGSFTRSNSWPTMHMSASSCKEQ
mmetsp:Transcript_55494/g.104250  ORF Transcript_55494/g.104250 Transcript_55494/m.104250 type:complete len:318 (+) Transcript_55494:1371-2324(+)